MAGGSPLGDRAAVACAAFALQLLVVALVLRRGGARDEWEVVSSEALPVTRLGPGGRVEAVVAGGGAAAVPLEHGPLTVPALLAKDARRQPEEEEEAAAAEWSGAECVTAAFATPLCNEGRAFDRTRVCALRNVCMDGRTRSWLYYGRRNGTAPPSPAPYLSQNGAPMRLRAADGPVPPRGARVRWRRAPAVLFDPPQPGGSAEYYQAAVRDLGALLWLLVDAGGPAGVDVVLASPSPGWPAFAAFDPAAETVVAADLAGPDELVCFRRLTAGCGCRSLWWQPRAFPFAPPYWVDFLALDPAAYDPARAGDSLPPADPHAPAPPARLFLRRHLLRALGLPAAAGAPRGAAGARVALVSRRGRRVLRNEAALARVLAGVPGVLEVVLLAEAGAGGAPAELERAPFPRVRVVRYEAATAEGLRAQARVIASSRALVGAHGAGLSSMGFLPPGGGAAVVELFGSLHQVRAFEVLARALGHWHAEWRPPEAGVADEACRDPLGSACKNRAFDCDPPAVAAVVRDALVRVAAV